MEICISRLQIPRLYIILDWNNDEYSDSQALTKKWELAAMNSRGRLATVRDYQV